jgi:putative transposase
VKYAHIYRNRHLWPVRLQCEVLKVSFTGYHQHQLRRQRIASRRHMTEAALLVHIRAIHRELRGAYGWPRMWRELRRRGLCVGKERVRLLMQQDGIQARGKRRFRVTTTDSKHSMPIAPNLLNRNFTVDRPNVAWTGDVTYIATEEGFSCFCCQAFSNSTGL